MLHTDTRTHTTAHKFKYIARKQPHGKTVNKKMENPPKKGKQAGRECYYY